VGIFTKLYAILSIFMVVNGKNGLPIADLPTSGINFKIFTIFLAPRQNYKTV
jgi:hypothetical protein